MTATLEKPRPATAKSARILVVDDDPIVAESLSEFLRAEGYSTATSFNAQEALATLADAEKEQGEGAFALVVSDVAMPGMDGMELLRRIGKQHAGTVVIMLTGYGTIESAVQAVRLGAADYLTKPVVDDELRIALERSLRQQALLAENRALKQQLDARFGLDSIVGSDARMLKIYDLITAVAPTKTTVLMTGESGTGKSLIAHAIHHRSPRKSKPFVELSCGSIPETLLESELFGHVKGAFTGAHADKTGKFLAASGGTLFLDEINSASPGMQLKLLRVLQERRFEPVGSNQTVEVDVRVILASNQPLEDLVARGTFRQDLYYRINVVKIELPPLRDRVSDVMMLAEHFLRSHAAGNGKTMAGFDPAALDLLRRYAYPGNVRELSNIVERAVVLSTSPTVRPEDLPPHVMSSAPAGSGTFGAPTLAGPMQGGAVVAGPVVAGRGDDGPLSLEASMKEPERQIILQALKSTGGNKLKAAEMLKINRTTL
ncbi:MAG: sigma-54-dependent transcriptional regulator, partial [Phycisphaerales bacterium]